MTSAHFLRGRREKVQQTKWRRKFLPYEMNKFHYCHPLNLRQDLEEKPFDNKSKCDDCEWDATYVKHRSDSVFDKSSDKEIS